MNGYPAVLVFEVSGEISDRVVKAALTCALPFEFDTSGMLRVTVRSPAEAFRFGILSAGAGMAEVRAEPPARAIRIRDDDDEI